MTDLTGRRVAFLATDAYEDSELASPWDAVVAAGASATLIAPERGEINGKKGHSQPVDLASGEAAAADYDALMLPGGTGNADHLRMDEESVRLVREFAEAGKPIAAICHGAWILTDADALRGRTITSFPSLKTDLRNAGATWVDEEVVVDGALVSSRTPKDLPAFNNAFIEVISQS
ncbi:type 1 glutamine amidotransferase domain-containing protein [Gulosibacter sp. 10]|uniref:type 1 glutamine amidotransferase domain-containing protein n=1 Tax=Gulosibacter sp. 10 TaxID=1255570 RepID=UPI00097E8D92|nr:type 1 glutamine amidotransferase domain-containing protein [Gulosibacter sp. 10]SJM56575.1 ThiJ/PfpI family protein [Gulosibacter sp. 10]